MGKRSVLLIGAYGGLGKATVKQLSNCGWHVFAADIHQSVFDTFNNSDDVTPLSMDVTEANSVEKAFHIISSQTTGLDAIINMSGILKIGSMVEVPISELEESLNINVLGVYRVNKVFLPLLLKQRGRIVILSSEVGRQIAAPFNGIYSISKHALEAYSDALRRELSFLDIKVIKIQPGPIKTNMTKSAEKLFIDAQKKSIYFKRNLAKGIPYLPKVYYKAHDPSTVAKTILKALTSHNPKTAYLIKADKYRMFFDLLPVRLGDALIKKFLS